MLFLSSHLFYTLGISKDGFLIRIHLPRSINVSKGQTTCKFNFVSFSVRVYICALVPPEWNVKGCKTSTHARTHTHPHAQTAATFGQLSNRQPHSFNLYFFILSIFDLRTTIILVTRLIF